jgi:hypothetical protein
MSDGVDMYKLLLWLAWGLVSFQAVATDEGLRNRRINVAFLPDLAQPLVMSDVEENDKERKGRLERLACQQRPKCFADLSMQLVSSGWTSAENLALSPEFALSTNQGDVVVYFPDIENEIIRQKQEQQKDSLKLYFENKWNKYPPLDPEGMENFPGNPDYLKLPKDYWRGLFLGYLDKRTACMLRECSKSLYIQLTESPATAEYFLKPYFRGEPRVVSLYGSPDFFNRRKDTDLWDAVPKLKALEWFKQQHPELNLNVMFSRLEDYELCPRVLFDRGYWRMKRKHTMMDPSDHSDWGDKVILATHGGDNLGSLMYFGFKTAINVGLLTANAYFIEGRPLVIPDTCHQLFAFPQGSFTPSIDARHLLFNWTHSYRMITTALPFAAILMKDLYMLTTQYNARLSDKERVLDLRSRWPVWKRESLPKGWQKDELALVTFAVAYFLIYHPQLIMWAIPLKGPYPEVQTTVGHFTQLMTTHTANSTWLKGCCMSVNNYVQPGCYVPWALDAAKEVATYGVREVANQGLARLVNIAPMVITGCVWTFYFMMVRGMI